jgi:hypothetical protein
VSPYSVNWLTTSSSAPMSADARFITPASSSNTRKVHSLPASHRDVSSSSS